MIRKILLGFLILVLAAATGNNVNATGSIDELTKLQETPEDRQVDLLFQKAAGHYTRSLSTLDEADVYRSIESLEEVIQRYPDSIYVRDAYWAIAEILIKKIQTKEAYEGAIQAYEDYLSRFAFYEEAWEAQYNIASINYLYLKDYDAAKEAITKLFEDFLVALGENEDRMKRSKILLAKILHKSGEYGTEIQALDEVEILDPAMDFGYHAELLRGIKANRILRDGRDKYIFMGEFDSDFPVKQLTSAFKDAENKIKRSLQGIERNFELEIFVYQDSKYFNQTTDRLGSFSSGPDAQVFYIAGQPIEPLFAQIYSFLINNLPSDLKISFFEFGLLNSFGNVENQKDTAALELGFSEDTFTGDILFDNGNFPTYISERESVAGSFVNYLLDKYPPEKFYQCYRMMEGSREFSIKLSGPDTAGYYVDSHRVSPETLMSGFENVYGVPFSTVRAGFLDSMKQRRAMLDDRLASYWELNPPGKLKLQQDSPENVLISYFKAIQAGDYDALRDCTTGELREILDDARDLYKEQGILDKVERWKLALPYMDVKIEVIDRQVLADGLVVFRVNLLKDGSIMEQKDLVASEKKGKWYIAEN